MKKDIIEKILAEESIMFQRVYNTGGRADCQDEEDRFIATRSMQWQVWPENALKSYLNDLEIAKKEGRNLLTEKYAFMMESTVPKEYDAIKDRLPTINSETMEIIEDILKRHITWKEELEKDYPYLAEKGRPLRTSEDKPNVTSIETYMRGELKTYSHNTLKLYLEHVLKEESEGINEAMLILENTVKSRGYKSLEEANEKIKLMMENK